MNYLSATLLISEFRILLINEKKEAVMTTKALGETFLLRGTGGKYDK